MSNKVKHKERKKESKKEIDPNKASYRSSNKRLCSMTHAVSVCTLDGEERLGQEWDKNLFMLLCLAPSGPEHTGQHQRAD